MEPQEHQERSLHPSFLVCISLLHPCIRRFVVVVLVFAGDKTSRYVDVSFWSNANDVSLYFHDTVLLLLVLLLLLLLNMFSISHTHISSAHPFCFLSGTSIIWVMATTGS